VTVIYIYLHGHVIRRTNGTGKIYIKGTGTLRGPTIGPLNVKPSFCIPNYRFSDILVLSFCQRLLFSWLKAFVHESKLHGLVNLV
jgi:hypothetical protein